MSRYIDVDKVANWSIENYGVVIPEYYDIIDAKELTEEVAPVVHAHNESDTSFMCSNCTFADFGLFNHGGKYEPNYCPNCGAKMDGGEL